jgi:hypothetical protein
MEVKVMEVIEAVKNIVAKTKKQVQEEERKQKLIEKFEEIFGFRPTLAEWNANWNLKAMHVVNVKKLDNKDFDDLIEGKQVIEIAFKLWEESKDVGYDLDWKFSTTKGLGANYYWIRRYGQFTACIEIITLT